MKWTNNMRKILYTSLKDAFGEHGQWEHATYPSEELKGAYHATIGLLSELFTRMCKQEITVGAVDNQIAWAITTQRKIKVGYNWFLCKRAAFDAGFIDKSYLPKEIEVEHQN